MLANSGSSESNSFWIIESHLLTASHMVEERGRKEERKKGKREKEARKKREEGTIFMSLLSFILK